MVLLINIVIILTLISTLLASCAFFLGKKTHNEREKLSAFECGFDPHSKARMPFRVQFFLVTIIFLIFDVEIIILLPIRIFIINITSTFHLSVIFLVIIILFLGLAYEWLLGSLDWTK